MSASGADRESPRLKLFGGPALETTGDEVLRLSPTQANLVTLVWGHRPRGITRRQAIGLLWEEDDGPRGRQRLRQLMHEVSVRVGARPFVANGHESIRPDPEALPSDLDQFAYALESGELGAALVLLQRGFASRLRRTPTDAFDDWLEAKRLRLRRELHEEAARRWDAHHRSGAWPQARQAAETLYALDPTEASLRRLMEARAAVGQVGLAEAAYAEFVRTSEAGNRPAPETIALLERIQRMAAPRRAGSGGASQHPLVGRRAELEKAMKVLDGVENDAFVFLMVRGEAGVGKTRLFDEVLREAHLKGFRCLQARPAELERHIPLNPLVDMVSHPDVVHHIVAMEEPWRAVVASLLPTVPPGMDPPVVPYIAETSLSRRLYDAFTFLLADMAGEQPTLLFIDDLQWADDTTLAVLQFAQRRWRSGALGVVATVRPDQAGGSRGVSVYLNENRDLPVTTITLKDLSEADAAHLVDLVAEGTLDQDTCRRLCALGGRNPFYLIELTKDYLAGRVQLPELPSDTLLIPISLRQLVDPRLEGLSQEASDAAAHLSVWGRWAPLSELAGLLGTDLDECTRHVEELERARLVTVERGSVCIAHQLFRGAIYHGMSNARRGLLHRSLAEYLSTTAQPLPGELAVHFAEAGEAAAAAKHGRTAADQALENGAVAEAAHFLQLVIENEEDPRLKAEATGDLARVLHMNREILRANPLLELAATRLRAVGNHARALRMEVRRVEGLAEIGATPMSELLDRLASIKTAARDAKDDEALAFALDHELHLLHRSGRVEGIPQLFGSIRECLRSPLPGARCQANATLAFTALFGKRCEGLEYARAAVSLADEHDLTEYRLTAMTRLYVVLLLRGLTKSPEALGLVEKIADEVRRTGDVVLRFAFRSNCGVAHMDAGELDAAAAEFEQAGRIITKAEASVLRVNHYCNLGELAYQRGNHRNALDQFQNAEDILGGVTTPADVAQLVNAGIGLCHLDLGGFTQARQRETRVDPLPDTWSFDPTMVLAFQTRLLERRGSMVNALNFISRQRASLQDCLLPAWLKTLPLELRIARKLGIDNWRELVRDGVEVANDLGFSARANELKNWLL